MVRAHRGSRLEAVDYIGTLERHNCEDIADSRIAGQRIRSGAGQIKFARHIAAVPGNICRAGKKALMVEVFSTDCVVICQQGQLGRHPCLLDPTTKSQKSATT